MAMTQDNRWIGISTPLGEDVLLLDAFHGTEAISSLFEFEADLLSSQSDIDLNKIVGEPVSIDMELPDRKTRYFHGIIKSFSHTGIARPFSTYRARIVPWFWLLTLTQNSRIFQNLSVPEIVRAIFGTYKFKDYEFHLKGTYEPREYCVQYRETAFNFVSRLLEEEGIFYFFRHEKDRHVLVVADDPDEFIPCPAIPEVKLDEIGATDLMEDTIGTWVYQCDVRTGKYSVHDFNFKKPSRTILLETLPGRDKRGFEVFDYPDGFLTVPEREHRARVRIDEKNTGIEHASGGGTCRDLRAGYVFTLKDHDRADQNRRYVATKVEHAVRVGQNYGTGRGTGGGSQYRNRFICLPHPSPFRPARVTPIPVVHGTQTAFVVGPPGEEIWPDEYGRVKVQFHWDREGNDDENSSCFIRVSQSLAGPKWGGMFLPRIRQEVIVDFLEGNPDRPLITGCVYNSKAMPPYELPAHKTRSTIKTNSSKGGDGFNEFRIEDKKGSEQIFVHAERNMDVRIKNDRYETVCHDAHMVVGGKHLTRVSGDQHFLITGEHHESMAALGTKVGGNHAEKADGIYSLEATAIQEKAATNLVLEAGVNITLRVGGSFITLTPAGIFSSVDIQMGGAPVPAIPCDIGQVDRAQEADTAEAGKPPAKPEPKKPRPVVEYSPKAIAFQKAAAAGLPFVPVVLPPPFTPSPALFVPTSPAAIAAKVRALAQGLNPAGSSPTQSRKAPSRPNGPLARLGGLLSQLGAPPALPTVVKALASDFEKLGPGALESLLAQVNGANIGDPQVFADLAALFATVPGAEARVAVLAKEAADAARASESADPVLVDQLAFQQTLADLDAEHATDPQGAAERAAELFDAEVDPERREQLFDFMLEGASEEGPEAVEQLTREMLSQGDIDESMRSKLALAYDVEGSDPNVGAELLAPLVERKPLAGGESGADRFRAPTEVTKELHLRYAQTLLKKGDTGRALAALEGLDPAARGGEIAVALGRAHSKAGNHGEAFEAFLTATAVAPTTANRRGLLEVAQAVGQHPDDVNSAIWRRREALAVPATNFSLSTLTGEKFSLSDHAGKVVVLSVLSSMSKTWGAEVEHLRALGDKNNAQGLKVVGIDVAGSLGEPQRPSTSSGADFLTGNIDSVRKALGVTATPSTVVVGRDGKVYLSQNGQPGEKARESATSLVAELVARRTT